MFDDCGGEDMVSSGEMTDGGALAVEGEREAEDSGDEKEVLDSASINARTAGRTGPRSRAASTGAASTGAEEGDGDDGVGAPAACVDRRAIGGLEGRGLAHAAPGGGGGRAEAEGGGAEVSRGSDSEGGSSCTTVAGWAAVDVGSAVVDGTNGGGVCAV